MTAAPLHTGPRLHDRLATQAAGARARAVPSPRGIARRRFMLTVSKLMMPVLALGLLASVALWPEFQREAAAGRAAYRRLMASFQSGRLLNAHYKGVDERDRPYAFTAEIAIQVTPERVDLTEPKGDVLLENGAWLMVNARQGVYIQHAGLLDLSGDVTLYRDDGITLHTANASIDLKRGAVMGADTVSAEGPFGTLDATGFSLVDKGALVQFGGPARLILNGHSQ